MTKAWVLAAVIGLMTSLLYVDQTMGLSVVFMTILTVTTMVYYKQQAGIAIGRKFIIISAYMILLSPVFAVTTVPVIRFWSGFILSTLLLALAVSEHEFIWPLWIKEGLKALFGALGKSINFFTHGSKVTSKNKKVLGQIFFGVVVAIPVLAVAASLLASADAVMDELLNNIFDALEFEEAGVWIWRLCVFLFVAAMTYGYKVWLAHNQQSTEGLDERPKTIVKLDVIPPAVSGTILVLLNCLYVVFAYIQIKFLFLGTQATAIEGYNYAEYARSGFFELVALSVLNTMGILVINRFTRVHLMNRISLTITAFCTFIMIASSWHKMHLYETEYGYTQLRLYVYMILAFMVVFMVLITLGIWKRNYRVIEWSIVIGLCYFLIISYVNVDAIIVENNVARYEKTGDIDLYYLVWNLTEDAVPALVKAAEMNRIDFKADNMSEEYDNLKRRIKNKDEDRQFFEYNYRHARAVKVVE